MAVKLALLALLVSFLLAAAPAPAHAERRGFRANMIRRTEAHATINFTRAAHKSRHRLSMLASRLDTASSRLDAQTPLQTDGDCGGAYDMEISIGTPPQKLTALADTGSHLIWAKCGACASCEPLGSPSYLPDKSSSFSKLRCSDGLCAARKNELRATSCGAECDYKYFYGGDPDHYTQGYLGSETITLGGDAVPDIVFGCTTMSEGGFGSGSGLVGLGRGRLSLVSQLNVSTFSYCLTRDGFKPSPLLFGSLATLSGAGGVQSTPLLPDSVHYTVSLLGISIGLAGTVLYHADSVVFDSGTTLTYLADPAYTEAKAAVLFKTDLALAPDRDGFEACFYYDERSDGSLEKAVPSMVLHFDGGADMALPVANYFVDVGGGVACWVVQRSPSGGPSIIGNVMQVDFNVLYDVDKLELSFQPAKCGSARLLSKFESIFLLTVLHVLYIVF